MPRFQAKTNAILDLELEFLQREFGLRANQKADLLREITSLATWIVRQTKEGRTVFAQSENGVRELRHLILDKIRQQNEISTTISLNNEETQKLAEIMNRDFDPPLALREVLHRLTEKDRKPPTLIWSKKDV